LWSYGDVTQQADAILDRCNRRHAMQRRLAAIEH
jgi:hypothetical protein